jgi:Terminase large subunit, T4likevirus-type, N-terminal
VAKSRVNLGNLPDPTPGGHGQSRDYTPPPPVPLDRMPSEQDAQAIIQEQLDAEAKEKAEWNRLFGPGYVSDVDADRLHRIVSELSQRKIEGLRLYEALPEQDRFHKSKSRVRLARGSNRSGKTLCAAVEVARAATGQDPYGKYPKENGRGYGVGKNLDHVGQVMWRKLGRAGAIKMIRDEKTKLWRAFRPWDPYDAAYREKCKEAPPLIPPRLIKHIAWESKGESIPSVVTLHNGWELAFYSSEGKPPQGSDLDLWWFDEEITDETWFPEMRSRILDRQGRGIWSATPQSGSDALFDLHERATEESSLPLPRVSEFVILLADNKHLGQQEKADLAADLTEEERRVRIDGEYAVASYKVYPSFSMALHGEEYPEDGVPDHWTRYAVVDPGHQVCAVLFAAVPPKEEGDFVYLYDELYIRDCDAIRFGEQMAQKVGGQRFRAFLMDMHFALHTEAGAGRSVLSQYTEALAYNKVSSETTGHSFQLASDDIQGGITAVRAWMAVRQTGLPKLRVYRDRLPHFQNEMKRYLNTVVKGMVTDKPRQKNNHLMDALRYLAMYNPVYVAPRPRAVRAGGAYAAFKAYEKKSQKGKSNGVRLGPGRKYA